MERRLEAPPRQLTREQMHQVFTCAGFDGVWSALTGLLSLLLGASGQPVRLNTAWCLSPQNFRCPVCGQRKTDLIRLSGKTVTGILHIDHDHMTDGINRLAVELKAGPASQALLEKYQSFSPLILCKACNHIDSTLKLLHPDIHPLFTLSPSQKKSLILKTRKCHHEIDHRGGYRLWLQLRAGFLRNIEAWKAELRDLAGSEEATPPYDYKKAILSEAAKRYIETLSGYNYFQEFHEFIRLSGNFSKTCQLQDAARTGAERTYGT